VTVAPLAPLAQAPAAAPTEIAWSTFAPEVMAVSAALALLLFAVAGRRRMLVAVPVGLVGLVAGVLLVAAGQVLPGVVAIVYGAAAVALTLGLAGSPPALHAWLAGLGAAGALALTVWQAVVPMQLSTEGLTAVTALEGSVAMDGIALFTRITVYATALLVIPLGHAYLRERGVHGPEFEPLLLLSAAGMATLGAANDLITFFVALEVLSIALYVMSGLARRDRRSQESAIKYFVLGAVASAVLLYGMALLYTATGTLDMPAIGDAISVFSTPYRVALIAMVLTTVGLGFKVALVPFHAWTPDVYEGAPTNVTAFMAAATKAAAFAGLLRMYVTAFGPLDDLWVPVLAVLAAITMMYGAVVAVVQQDVKRILAYSALSHAGYAAIGVAAASPEGVSATLWYLLTYALSTLVAFGAVIAVERRNRRSVTLADLRGLGRTSPALAGILTVALLSLAGIPPLAGFVGKLQVFSAGVAAGLTWLVVVGVVSSVIAAFFYLRIMGMMFLEEPAEGMLEPAYSTGWSLGINLAAALVVYLGLQPAILLDLADKSAVLAR
jgi:NADH-quinone oxidoreductase subunit N